MDINFFWSGDAFDYLNYLTIKSHIKVGHGVVIHLHGDTPKSKYWDRLDNITVKDADEIIDISSFMKSGGNFRTASSLWRFKFLYEYGGYYSDCDAVAIKHWPSNKEWVLCSGDSGMISTGVIKTPPKEEMFLDMMTDIQLEWGNIPVFNQHYKIYKGNNDPNYKTRNFYPFLWKRWFILLEDLPIPKYVYSVHLFNTMFDRNNKIKYIENWIRRNPNTMLGRLDAWINE